jgi:putative ABC transport system permease protein
MRERAANPTGRPGDQFAGQKTVYRALLYCYPAAFRHEFGDQMLVMFVEQLYNARQSRNFGEQLAIWMRAASDALTIAPKEHFHVIHQDLRYALRLMAAKPTFAAVAILSLALGIGGNTAIFSLWNGVLNTPLPAVSHPEQLVMLTDPDAFGMWHGRLSYREDGPRAWLTYEEFEHLRDHADSFSSLMASEANLDSFGVRVDSGDLETVDGRFVSGGFFDTLGVHAATGRLFTPDDDHVANPTVVISYDFWQRRFSGHPIVGKTIAFRKATLTILGVATRGFIGETSGQNPDLWLPIRMQPILVPKQDWLHDTPPTKAMWLHALGRLKPGVTFAQAEAQSNAIFEAGLESFYGPMPEEKRRDYLDQRLHLTPAARGASTARKELSSSLEVLLIAVGVLLLITCANLANLLLARGAARKSEIALRLSLGASRGRIVRQLVTESLTLGLAGGAAGLALARFIHDGLIWMISQAHDSFAMHFSLNPIVLAFAFAATITAVLLFSVLPAFEATKTGARLSGQSRNATASAHEKRWGRYLVSLQLALSLPLLAGAGLLARTLYNIDHVDLGFAKDHLITLRIDSREGGYQGARRGELHRELSRDLAKIPGVRAVTFSQLGIFTGGESSDQIDVEGYTPKNERDRGSATDVVGSNYFSTLGVPLILGRDILDNDRGGPKVCVINEAFAKKFFGSRNPIGMHVTRIEDNGVRDTFQVVGVARNLRTHFQEIRGKVDPRYFAAAAQSPEASSPTFLIRTATKTGLVASAARKVIERWHPALPIMSVQTLEKRMESLNGQDRIIAQLAIGFAAIALALAAIGLYGVLSYGIARRTGEIGVRIALGARPGRVISMLLRETFGLIAVGLVIGAGLAYGASRLIKSQLYGVAAQDPLTFFLAGALLLAIAVFASYLPARRASKLDPMVALRQE